MLTFTRLSLALLGAPLAFAPAWGAEEADSPFTRLEVASSFNPVGSGARALGMGGAFIPVADDATAASWNPAGLVQLEKAELSIVGDYLDRTEDNTFNLAPEGSHSGGVSATRLNYLSASYPFQAFERNMIVSLNYQHLYDFDRQWDFSLSFGDDLLSTEDQYHYEQDGGLYAIGLAYAVQLTPTLSLGATLNFWEDLIEDNGWQQNYRVNQRGDLAGSPFSINSRITEDYQFSGFNMNLGLLWQLSEKLTLGAVLKTPFDADIQHSVMESSEVSFPDFPEADSSLSSRDSRDETLKMPMSYGIGLAYRHNDALTIATDLYRTEWSRFTLVDANGVERSPLSGRPTSEVDGFDDTLWVRLGAEYLFIKDEFVIPLRGGLFYDPSPTEGGSDEYYGFTLGSGVAHKQLIFDLAYQYRKGDGVGENTLPQVGLSQDITEHRVYASLIVHL
jgi:long-subunit fatty acid transport protein